MLQEARIKALVERLRMDAGQRTRWSIEDREIDQGRSQFHNGASQALLDAAEQLEMLLEASSVAETR